MDLYSGIIGSVVLHPESAICPFKEMLLLKHISLLNNLDDMLHLEHDQDFIPLAGI